ncbi:TonB-dependent receptor [Ancylomarina euxinus]|uniref:TonB-dependent receptor n=1 Tax=Ancylomarina euxinus TaxID=2283627 RepID=A0A425Y3N8_9BACT|nr:TonB-dependent receptor [Ancylomarina euxinus]MCZ4694480.1 TonB-dependent receptor [Ancylomarina euxinus]MUP14023.1 TonB-dependent receptor [Ancylomarina euxinus]RRG22883.1 TonB-dependent receptor [Ancylomarina euxinus]
MKKLIINTELSYFRKWTRQSYYIFRSISKECVISSLLVTYFLVAMPKESFAQADTVLVNNNQKLDEVVVSAQRASVTYSQMARVVTIMDKATIESAPVQSLQDLLEYVLNVDVRQRGNHGVQADVSIRGGSFDQTMILLNGVNITDPQTGHLSLNLPVDIESIERVEVLQGPGARVYGPNAFSGAINFITGTENKNKLKANISAGENGFYSGSVNTTLITGKLKSYVALAHKTSDGYIENTDFRNSNVFYQGQLSTEVGLLDLQLGYNEKAYGANSFYTASFPNQFEENKTSFASLRLTTNGKVKMTPNIYWRRSQDRFELFRNNPASWYQNHNYHLTDVYGTSMNFAFSSSLGKTAAGFEFRSENVWSNVLGELMEKPMKVPGESGALFTKNHTRTNLSYFLEHNVYLDRFTFTAGVLANWNSDLDRSFSFYPGMDVSYQLTETSKLYASVNKSLRMPTFTDLYYVGPTNIGNTDLDPEKATTYETGLKFNKAWLKAHAGIFRREGRNMIDWVKANSEDKWQAQNITELDTWGIEFSSNINIQYLVNEDFFINDLSIKYAYLEMDKSSSEFISRYVLDQLKHKLNISLNHKIYKSLGASWQFAWQDRNGSYTWYNKKDLSQFEERSYRPFWLVDSKLYWQKPTYTVYLEASNLLNQDYYDMGNITQPGRWIRAGVKLNIDL